MKGPNHIPDRCPQCGAYCDSASSITEEAAKPSPRDFSICIYCCAINQFDEHLNLVKAEQTDIDQLLTQDPKLNGLITFTQGFFYYAHDKLMASRKARGDLK